MTVKMTTINDRLADMDETAVVLSGFDDAAIGLTEIRGHWHIVYDYRKCIAVLTADGEMDEETAVEYFEYNTIRALPYIEHAPIVITAVEDL